MICNNCQSTEIHTDSARGCIYCGECGMVQEENTIVSSLQFDSTAAKSTLHGKMISVDNANIGTQFIDSSYYIKNTISSICIKLGLGSDHTDCAFRWYKLCLQYSLSKGKSILYTLSACVYITCRQESTPHLLIDFSNALRIDMFKIGKVFLKLRNLLGVDIPLIDPSLYMHRFVSQLKFENKNILEYSIRLVARMKKDWILTGRRPNNSCGAALLISSRIFREERNITEIAKVVHASTATISKRLAEIAATESANLGIEEFRDIWLDEEENPPAKKRNIKKAVQKNEVIQKPEIHMNEIDSIYATPNATIEQIKDEYVEDDEFNIDDLILNETETNQKRELWESMYGDYEVQQENKRKVKPKTVIKKRTNKHNFDSIEEAFKSLDHKVSSKLNYSAIEGLFD